MKKTAEKTAARTGSSPFKSLSEAANYLDVSVQTLYTWRSRGLGPPAVVIGNRVKYRQEALDAWIGVQEQAEADRVVRLSQIPG